MPYPYSYFKPTGKEQGAMAIGSLLAGLLSAAQPRQPGDASPVLKGIEGATAGYGGGYKAYQDMMGDAFTRDLYDRKFGQDTNQFDQQMGLSREKFGEEKRQYEETDKPYKQAMIGYLGKKEASPAGMGRMNEYSTFKGMNPEEQGSYLDYLSKTGYNRVLGMDETGNPIFVPTRGNVQLKTPANHGMTGTQTPPISGKDIQPFIKPVLAESAQENIARGDTLQQNINRVRALYKPEYVGAGDALQGKIGETIGSATDDNEKKFRAAVNSLYTNMFAEGGKALTEGEQKILKPIFPSFWKGQENFPIDLSGLETKYRELMKARIKTHKDSGMRNVDKVEEGLTQPTITATNPKTGQKIMSNDGGKTWEQAQ